MITKDNLLKKVKEYSEDDNAVDKNFIKIIKISSNQKLLLFLSSGKVLTLDPNLLPSGKAAPKSFIEFIDVGMNEKLISVFNANTQKKIILVTKLGKGFISEAKQMITNQKKGKNIINLKNNDELLNAHQYDNNYLALVSKNEKLLIFDVCSLPTLNKGAGVQIIKLKENDYINDSLVINAKAGLSWCKG